MNKKNFYISLVVLLFISTTLIILYNSFNVSESYSRFNYNLQKCEENKDDWIFEHQDLINRGLAKCTPCSIISQDKFNCIRTNCDNNDIIDCVVEEDDRDDIGDYFFICYRTKRLDPVNYEYLFEPETLIALNCLKNPNYNFANFCKNEKDCPESKCTNFREKYYSCDNLECKPKNRDLTIGYCGVDCINNLDCDSGELCKNYKCNPCKEGKSYCEEDSLMSCKNKEFKFIEECKWGCNEGKCKNNPFLMINVLILIIFITLATIIFIVFKKFKWRKNK